MDIKIPKTKRRYTAETMAELTSLGMWDDTDTMREKFKSVKFTEKWEEVPVKTIGMWMSGGADSSMCVPPAAARRSNFLKDHARYSRAVPLAKHLPPVVPLAKHLPPD